MEIATTTIQAPPKVKQSKISKVREDNDTTEIIEPRASKPKESSTPAGRATADAVDGGDAPIIRATPQGLRRTGGEGRAPPTISRGRLLLRAMAQRSVTRRERTPASDKRKPTRSKHAPSNHTNTPKRTLVFGPEDTATDEVDANGSSTTDEPAINDDELSLERLREEDEFDKHARRGVWAPHEIIDLSQRDEDESLRDYSDYHGARGNDRRTPSTRQGDSYGEDDMLQREWRKIPRNYQLPSFDGRKEEVLSFLDGLEHAYDTWGINPSAHVRIAFAQCRDSAARRWMKSNHYEDFNTFRTKFTERFGSHTLRRDALRALRDIRQIGAGCQGFVTAFERVLEGLDRHNLNIGDHELLVFLELAVNEKVRDALDWASFTSTRAALHKIANLSLGQASESTPRPQQAPRDHRDGPAARAAPQPHQPSPAQSQGTAPRRCHSCGSEDHLRAQCPRNAPPPHVPFNNGRGHQGNVSRRPGRL